MKRELNNYTILNGKYAIEQYIGYQNNCYKYKATDLVMREEVYIYEFCPVYIMGRIENSDRLNINESLYAQFSEELEVFESNLSSVALGKRNDEIAKNYFRENNTGYLVVVENRKALIRSKLITRVVLGMLIVAAVIEVFILANEKNNLRIAENEIINILEEKTIDDEIANDDINYAEYSGDLGIEADELIAQINQKDKAQRVQLSEEELINNVLRESGALLYGSIEENEIIKFRDSNLDLYEFAYFAPDPEFAAYIYEDFDSDGYKELFALTVTKENPSICDLWFSNGEVTKKVDLDTSHFFYTWFDNIKNEDMDIYYEHPQCRGLMTVQCGKLKQLEIIYNDGGFQSEVIGSNIFGCDGNKVYSLADEKRIIVKENEDGFVSMFDVNSERMEFKASSNLDSDIFSKIVGNDSGLWSWTEEKHHEYDVYCLNGKYYQYNARYTDEEEIQANYINWDEIHLECENILKEVIYHPPHYEASEEIINDIKFENMLISENDKLYLNYTIYTTVFYTATDDQVGTSFETEISVVYSADGNRLYFNTIYPEFHTENAGLLDTS